MEKGRLFSLSNILCIILLYYLYNLLSFQYIGDVLCAGESIDSGVCSSVSLGVRVATALIFQFSVVELASKITSRDVLKLF